MVCEFGSGGFDFDVYLDVFGQVEIQFLFQCVEVFFGEVCIQLGIGFQVVQLGLVGFGDFVGFGQGVVVLWVVYQDGDFVVGEYDVEFGGVIVVFQVVVKVGQGVFWCQGVVVVMGEDVGIGLYDVFFEGRFCRRIKVIGV